jgi:hypothetical protein
MVDRTRENLGKVANQVAGEFHEGENPHGDTDRQRYKKPKLLSRVTGLEPPLACQVQIAAKSILLR